MWYKIFYWISIADGVKSFFDWMSNLFTVGTVIIFIFYIIFSINYADNKNKNESTPEDQASSLFWIKNWRRLFIWSTIIAVFTWTGYVFTPTKKDAIMIVAGGAVGNFITSDSSAKAIPYELTLLVREKLKSEIQDLKAPSVKDVQDTLVSKSKEELINIIKSKQN